jgi:hypothetical protein
VCVAFWLRDMGYGVFVGSRALPTTAAMQVVALYTRLHADKHAQVAAMQEGILPMTAGQHIAPRRAYRSQWKYEVALAFALGQRET